VSSTVNTNFNSVQKRFIKSLSENSVLTPYNVVQLGEPPDRIDILTSVKGVTFEEAYPLKETLRVDDLEVTFIDFDSLIKTKTATGRAGDTGDIEDLQRQKDE
jgi:hypothetical protein